MINLSCYKELIFKLIIKFQLLDPATFEINDNDKLIDIMKLYTLNQQNE